MPVHYASPLCRFAASQTIFSRWARLLSFCLLAMVSALGNFAAADQRPNVVVIICDDIRWDALSCAGHPHLKTPNIDQLATQGIFFDNMFCTTSLCSPSRGSIISGLYAHAHGVTDNFTDYPANLRSFPLQLQAEGYATAYLGKWHMGEENDDPRPGFDYFVTHKGQGKYFDTEFNFHGRDRRVVPGYYTTVVTDMAEQWINQQSADKPYLLMLGHKAPHSFYIPEPKYESTYDDVEINYPHSAFRLDDKPDWIRQRLPTWHGIYGPLFDYRKNFPNDKADGVLDFAQMVRSYWGTILSVDDSVARLVNLLRQRGELDNTVIVFMGDNGILEGEHGMVDKRTAHEASMRIPMIIRYPKLEPQGNKRIAQQVLTVDVAPTILELCNAEPLENIHGQSVCSIVKDRNAPWRNAWMYYYNYEKQFPYTPNVRAIRTDRWKYIRYPHGDGGPDRHMAELYDLENDPGELTNLISDPAHQDLVVELGQRLQGLLLETGIEKDTMPIDAGIGTELPDESIR